MPYLYLLRSKGWMNQHYVRMQFAISMKISIFSSCKVSTICWYLDFLKFLSFLIIIWNGQNVEWIRDIYARNLQYPRAALHFITYAVLETLLVNGGWNEWSPWSICTKTVSGIQIRFRECSNPEPAYGGEHCNGSRALVRECNKMSSCHEGNIQMVKSVSQSFSYKG